MITSIALTDMGIEHYIVVEPNQEHDYIQSIKNMNLKAEVLVMDMDYKKKYDTCDDDGYYRSVGPGAARNFIWDHSIKAGFDWHWVMDDNIKYFYRNNKNLQIKVKSAGIFRAMEDFCKRYKNVSMGGPNYKAFVVDKVDNPHFILNTRIYSCNLIRNDVNLRWRGRYNEDTILSIDMLKAGWCTISFNAFLQSKMETQKLSGGNTTEFYHAEGVKEEGKKYTDTGTINKSMMQVKVHPDVSKITWRYGRVHHYVDYAPFKKNKLLKEENIKINTGINNYGMELKVMTKHNG